MNHQYGRLFFCVEYSAQHGLFWGAACLLKSELCFITAILLIAFEWVLNNKLLQENVLLKCTEPLAACLSGSFDATLPSKHP